MADMMSNEIRVGNKEFLTYMRSIELLFRKKKYKELTIVARGQNIKKAVDLAEASKNKFLKDFNIKVVSVKTGTSKFNDSEGIEKSVSNIEIKIVSE